MMEQMPPLGVLPVEQQRQLTEQMLGAGSNRRYCRDLEPAGEPSDGRTLLYLHGGGYVVGSASGYRSRSSYLAAACAARVCAIDYRLAPEYPFPVAVEDALAVLDDVTALAVRLAAVEVKVQLDEGRTAIIQ